MISETLWIFVTFVLAVSILPLYVLVLVTYFRSKRAVVEGICAHSKNVLGKLGWSARKYVGVLDLVVFWGPGWQQNSLDYRLQNTSLQRIAMHGLPQSLELMPSVQKAARRYRLLFWCGVLPTLILGYFLGAVNLGVRLGETTSTSPRIWILLLLAGICLASAQPFTKFKTWPEIEGTA
ncbi:hypothetical protein [Ruegeria arenilitoris]|uniref:hypothetical protein n=1 Tax=Ruegeria arenilitoris TaxID=1173585 RepID=UPI0014805171|nr:hypothetical protein [Ruegeria arenilitoris]